MGNNYSTLVIKKVNNLATLSKLQIHNFRQLPTAAKNADLNMTYRNVTLVNPGVQDYAALWRDRQYEVNLTGGVCKPRRGAVYAYEIVLGYSHGAVPTEKVNDWAQANIKWLGEVFGGDKNVLSAVLHLDEHTPHIHAIVMPIDERGHLCARSFTGTRKKMFELRDSYAEAMECFGLKRAERYTKASNKDLKKYYTSVNSIAKTKAPEKLPDETPEVYADRCEEWVRTVEYKALDRVNKANKDIARLFAKQETYNLENRYVTHLNNLLMIKYCGNKKRVKKILRQFTVFIDNVPINTLEKTMDFLQEKFVKGENILAKENVKDDDLELPSDNLEE